MRQLFNRLNNYLTWHPEALVYAGLAILAAGAVACWALVDYL